MEPGVDTLFECIRSKYSAASNSCTTSPAYDYYFGTGAAKSPPCRHPSSPSSGEWSGDFSFVEFKQELFRLETQASLELFGTKALAGGGGLAVFYLLQLSLGWPTSGLSRCYSLLRDLLCLLDGPCWLL